MNRRIRLGIIRFCLFIVTALTSISLALGQGELRQVLFEEIQAVPEQLKGEWTIGDRKFTVDGDTLVSRSLPPKVGTVAVIEYFERDGNSIITRIQPLPIVAKDISDGPYVFWKDLNTVEVVTVNKGEVERQVINDIQEPRQLKELSSSEKTITLDPEMPTTPRSSWDAPNRLLAISDMEGNYHNVLRFLQNNEVLDDDGHWNWGDGHLVLLGDLVDRGFMVTELMWLMRRLEREAKAAGGQVHYVLGNHEAMVMAGDIRYVHPKYHFVASRVGIPYDKLYGVESDIGRWWRTKNGVERIGDLLFVHGGYSPLLDRADLDIDTLNQRIRDGLAPNVSRGKTAATNPVLHKHGPFWYRGYFDRHALEWGGKATPEEIARILERHGARHVVIGHTLVEQVGPLDETGRVIAIDVEWKNSKKCQGLLQENGSLWRLTMTAQREELTVAAVK